MELNTELFEDYRWKNRLSKRQMALYLGIKPDSYRYILMGKFRNMSKVDGFAAKLGLKPKDILK